MAASAGTYPCLGGCGARFDPERNPTGLCPDCERRFGSPEGL